MKKKLGELAATSICGNDISSSCLYVSALAIAYAGQYAWVSLLMVAVVLFLFRKIYGEVVGALPLNGGAYNALLNTTSKSTASVAATLTILSYMATAVISASEGMHYVKSLWSLWPVIVSTIILLSLFMILTIAGIKESALVATIIFIFHMVSLVALSLFCVYYIYTNGLEILTQNFNRPVEGGIKNALFFGFAAAMLGISGFESSANFVEEQDKGVFRKTLRNMWIVVSVFNPLMAFLALSLVPIPSVSDHKETLLSYMGEISGGGMLSTLISVDAALVLSGAVLTSFIGVTGLVERMTLDRILPQFMLRKNKSGSSYRIPILFFLLCVSVLMITKGELDALAGVYTIAFLSVMTLFGFGNFLLKVKRKNLRRPEKSTWLALFVAVVAVIAALAGNIIMNPHYLGVFLEYLIPSLLIIVFMLNRTIILRFNLKAIKYLFRPIEVFVERTNRRIMDTIDAINSQEFVFFTHEDDVAVLNKVMLYITKNEHTRNLKIVTIIDEGEKIPSRIESDIGVLQREYPRIRIKYIKMQGTFGPKMIQKLSKEWNIPVNFMFIGSPGDDFPYEVSELGGVRLII